MDAGEATVVAVVGARGGVGTSTLAALLARRLAAEGERVVLVDLDRTGGGLEVLLGTEGVAGLRWADVTAARDPIASTGLRGLLPSWHGVHVLGHDRRPPVGPTAGGAPRAATWPVLRAGWDVVVVDLPAGGLTDPDVAGLLEGAVPVVVTSQDVPGVAAALAVRDALGGRARHLVVRRRARATVAPVEVARAVGMRLVASVPTARSLGPAVDRGVGPGVLGARAGPVRAAGRVAAAVTRG